MSMGEQLAAWAVGVRFDDLPDEVLEHTRLRILDVIGLALAGHDTPFGTSVREAVHELEPVGPARVLGSGTTTSVTGAAFVNGALSQALEFDDTHNRSVVHMSSPAVAAALALAEARSAASGAITGRDLVTAIAVGNEISCRIGSIAPRQFHKRGFHPTAMFAPFGVTALAGRMLGLDGGQLGNALGIVGSFASGLLQCWVDGTQTKFLHPGWAAQSGITAAMLGRTGTTGPSEVIEGRWGLIAAHVQDADVPLDFDQLTEGLGTRWESENASFKPYPVAHVIHPYIDVVLRLRERYGIVPADIERVDCPIAAFQVGIVCEPITEKLRPQSDSHGRVSLQFTLAEAIATGRIDRSSYSSAALHDPEIQALAARVFYAVDDSYPGPEQFKGEVFITLRDGRVLHDIDEFNRGSRENPMERADILAKFDDNASAMLPSAKRDTLADAVLTIGGSTDAGSIVGLSLA
jgi:2-methylcitrate dehydratase PrpD